LHVEKGERCWLLGLKFTNLKRRAVFRIRIHRFFLQGLGSAYRVSNIFADPDLDPGSEIFADPDPGLEFPQIQVFFTGKK